ncbi:MAG TPA: bifunctional phosphoribosylaminoimidazolecarboxamide formyltransferase/IMP cyclohydrolase [Armatimonadota bacterium]|nr:bifunctional phosphoribosylaminoimidazolecarboxamide formyltransferase/IMP cyclohydrolase [Armatimonadota bacterium]
MSHIKCALVSVSDKAGIVDFVRGLMERGVEILSTGGTARTLAAAGLPVREVADYTGFPEMMDGRVKTLHPKVHGAILARRDVPEDVAAARQHGIELIDMVVVNLYPFRETVAKPGVALPEAVEQIDIGGPSMVRSAAKNHAHVAIVCRPARYDEVLAEMRASNGSLSDATRLRLAVEAFGHTAAYDAAIHTYLSRTAGEIPRGVHPEPTKILRCAQNDIKRRARNDSGGADNAVVCMPDAIIQAWEKRRDLRYGENPHQAGAFYGDTISPPSGLAAARQLHGKELSFNNYLDLDAAMGIVADLGGHPPERVSPPAAAIFKHTSPCGAATAATLAQAYRDALACDPLSAFGGIIGLNQPVDVDTAQAILEGIKEYGFMECVIAPGFAPDALEALKTKRDLRLLEAPMTGIGDRYDFKRVAGGLVVQGMDVFADGEPDLTCPTKKKIPAELEPTARFAWRVARWVKSNAIVIARDTRTVGIGGGVTSRVDAAWLAVRKAGERARGAVLASDALFPKPDTIEVAAQAGVVAIIQPGGSLLLGDQKAIDLCNRLGIAMVLTGRRHFRH